MVFPLNFLAALITPSGRLPQFPFAMLCVALAFANLWLYKEALYARDGLGDTWMAMLLAMIWMKFCLMSRRMHDTGSSGVILVPLLFAAIATFLMSYDPGLVGAVQGQAGKFSMVIDHGTKGVRTLFVAVFLYLLRAPSEGGPNGYGPEWGDEEEAIPAGGRQIAGSSAQALRSVKVVKGAAPQAASDSIASRGSTRAARNALARLESLNSRPPPRIVAAPEPAPEPKPRGRGFAAGTPVGAGPRNFSRRG